jgi:hypothetical protein
MQFRERTLEIAKGYGYGDGDGAYWISIGGIQTTPGGSM